MVSPGLIETLGMVNVISLLAVVAIGLPHGAMDGAVALALGYGRNWPRMGAFILGYIALAGLVVMFWLGFPVLALALFLLISLVHFGNGDTDTIHPLHRLVQILCHGGIVVVAIPLFHPNITSELFSYLSGPDAVVIRSYLYPLAMVITVAGLIYAGIAIRIPSMRLRFLEFIGLLMCVWALPPLAGFAIYFAGVHTPRHVRRIFLKLRAHDPAVSPFRLTALFTSVTWIGGALAYFYLAERMAVDAAAFQVIFIGLAALTFPHMILIDAVFRPKMRDLVTETPDHDQNR
ncbi:Brp/Blh family beta-carotene 15,15'-dioxygenase [Alphaproteobacteria bacterium LSUCC0684]